MIEDQKKNQILKARDLVKMHAEEAIVPEIKSHFDTFLKVRENLRLCNRFFFQFFKTNKFLKKLRNIEIYQAAYLTVPHMSSIAVTKRNKRITVNTH